MSDTDKLKPLEQEFSRQEESLKSIIFAGFGKQINLNSQKQLLEALQNCFKSQRLSIENTNRETLASLAPKSPIFRWIMDYRKVSKNVQFIKSLSQHVHPVTGRIHPEYKQLGAVTGRFSCCNPNLQQVPRNKLFRECVRPAPGHKMVIADYSQIDLRVAAEISQDSRMIEAYNQGQDLHKLTASLIKEKALNEVSEIERQLAKAVNFGLIYAMGAKSLQIYAQSAYGVTMTEQQAEDFRRKFFNAYQGLKAWHEIERMSTQRETRTLLGRRRLWQDDPELTQVLNAPVQGTGADIIKKALVMLPDALIDMDVKIISCVHDEIILEAPEDKAQQAAQILKEVMEKAGQEYLKTVPVVAETSIVDSWAGK